MSAAEAWAGWVADRMLTPGQIAALVDEPEEPTYASSIPQNWSNPFVRTGHFIRHLSRLRYGLSVADQCRLAVRLDVPPRGAPWIACPAGHMLAPIVRLSAPEIAAQLAEDGARRAPGFWAQEVVADGGHLNVRWA